MFRKRLAGKTAIGKKMKYPQSLGSITHKSSLVS
jgi:hypothetical protein